MALTTKTHRSRPIGGGNTFQSKVDIIIPFHGQYHKVTRLIESILRFTHSNPYHLILVDDCSPNTDYMNHLSEIPQFELVTTPERLGFAGAAFHGFKKSKNPWVCFVNSDCVIEDQGWLSSMGNSLLAGKKDGIKMVSPLTNNALGHDYQEMAKQSYYGLDDFAIDDFVLDINHKDDDGNSDPQYLSMYCFMCHRELFKKCGGFIREYPYGWYEDMEFAYRMNHNKYKQAVCRSAWIYHEGECTVRELWKRHPESRAIMEEENYQKCLGDLRELFAKR